MNQADTPDGDGNESKAGSKLDNLSREDLVKFVKKQMVLLQKSKSHSVELSRELAETKEKLKKQTDVKAETKYADEDADERGNIIQAYNASQTALEESASKIAGLTEQVSCLQQKNETLTALYQSMQTELDTMSSRNKELENSLFLMSEARDEAVKQLDVRRTSGGPTNADPFVCSKCGEMKTKLGELMIVLEELRQTIEPVESERNQLKLDLSQSQEKLAKAVIFIDKLKKERQQLKEQITELQSSQSMLSDLQEALDTVRQEQLATNEEKLKVFAELESAKTDLTKSLGDYEKVVSEKRELLSQFTDLQKAFDNVEQQYKDVQSERDVCAERLEISQRNLDDIAQQFAKSQEEKSGALANSLELQKAFDNVVERLEVATSEKQAADKELEDLQRNLSRSQEEKSDVLANSLELQKAFDNVIERLEIASSEKQAAGKELEDLRRNLSETTQIAGEGGVDAERLQDVEEQLIRTKEELAATQLELESEKMRSRELGGRVSRSEETGEETLEPVSRPSGEAAGPEEDTMRYDLIRELNLQIDQLKAELLLYTTKDQGTIAMIEEPGNQDKEYKSSIGESYDENKSVETDAISDDTLKIDAKRDPEEEAGEWTPISQQTSLSENEVLLLREKLAEWETMMQMLQTERDDMERELVRMGQREKRDGCLLEEILLALQIALKGRDLFHDQTKTMEDNGVIYAKLCVLQSIIDETNFERDEMREKIQHLTEQVVDLEKRISETAGCGEASSTNSRSKEDDGIFSEAGEASQAQPRGEQLLESGSEIESAIGSQNEKVEGVNDEVFSQEKLLNIERTDSEKWKSNYEEMQRVMERLTTEKEQLEKALREALSAKDQVRLDGEQHSESKEKEGHDGDMLEVMCDADDQTHLCEAAAIVDAEPDKGNKEELLMTEQVKQMTVRNREPLVIQVQSEDERQRLLEENRSLREEIQLLKKQLEVLEDHSAEIVGPQVVRPCKEEEEAIVSSEKDVIGERGEASQAEKDIMDSSNACALDAAEETVGDAGSQYTRDGLNKGPQVVRVCKEEEEDVGGSEKDAIGDRSEASQAKEDIVDSAKTCMLEAAEETVGVTGAKYTLDGLKKEISDAESLLREKRDELRRLSEEIDSTERSSSSEVDLERLREECSRVKAELEIVLQDKDSEILGLRAELVRASEELEKRRERNTDVVALREELDRMREELDHLREEREDLIDQKQTMISEFTTVQNDLDVANNVCNEKNAEIQRLLEEHRSFKKDAEERVEEYKSQLEMAVDESGQSSGWDHDQVSVKDAEVQRLEDMLIELREKMESRIRDKDDEINTLNVKVAVAAGESEEQDRAVITAREEVQRHLNEILHLKSELSRIQDETGESQTRSDSELEALKAELARFKALADEKEGQLDTVVEDLRTQLHNMMQEMDEKNQSVRELEQEILGVKEESDKEAQRKNAQIADLEELLEKLRNDSEGLTVGEQLQQSLEHRIRDRDAEIESMRFELLTVREQSEGHAKDKDDEIERLKMELIKVKEEMEADEEKKISEIDGLTAELGLRAGLEDNVKVRDIEIEALKLEIVRIKDEFEDRRENSDCEFENARTELLAVNQQSQSLIKTKDQEISHLQEELLRLKDIESRFKDTKGQLKDIEGQLKNTEGQLKNTEGQLKNTEGQLKDTEGQWKDTEVQLKVIEGQLRDTEGQLKDVESRLRDKTSANEQLDAELLRIREQNETLINDKESEMNSLKEDIAKSTKETDDLTVSKDSEIRRLLAEIDRMRDESTRMQASGDARIEDLEKRLGAFQNDAPSTESLNSELQELRSERDRMRLIVNRQEGEIEQLREEVTRGKNLMESSFERRENEQLDNSDGTTESSPHQMTSSSSPSDDKVAKLEQQLNEWEERGKKLKQLTLKAKKESTDLRTKLTTCQKDLDAANAKLLEASNHNETNQSIQYQSLQTEYDKLESQYESEKSMRLELQKSLKQAIEELSNVKVAAADMTEDRSKMNWDLQKLERERKELETLCAEKEQEVQAERIQREQLARDKLELEKRATKAESQTRGTEDELKMEIRQLQDQLKAAKQELDFAKTEIQQTNMMDLEIADYERAVKTLHQTVADRDAKVKVLQEEVEQQQEQRTALQKLLDSSESQYSQLDDHCSKLKQLLVKSKKDLAEAKKLEGEQRTVDAQMRGQLERLTQLTEEQKLQISSLVAENQRQAEKLRLHSDSHQRTAQSLEQRVQSLEQDLQLSRSEMGAVQAEYDSYKVRVHSVLKHQKTRSSTGDDPSVEQERLERQQMEKLVESLKTRLADVSQQVASISSEYDLLQEEHDRLQMRHSKLIAEMETNERGWRDRLEKLNAESSLNSMKKVEVIQQLTVQSEIISSSYKDQIQSAQEEHHRVVESLRQQLETAEIELDRYHARFQNMTQNHPSNSIVSFPALEQETSSSDRVLEFVKELRPEERQSGEGSETVDDVHAKMSSTANHSLLPFEQLLDSTQMDDVMSVKTMESTAEEMMLRANLVSSEKRIEHLSQILNESEATVLRLTEQASILKTEIRRMERNQERETAISNMEYLKNVVYKFMTLKSGDERMQLIPVLTTMLKFSPDEKDKMTAIAAGTEGAPPAGQDAAGWGTYLHRWSGLV